jgi:aminoglycoside phosphotransferase (APT) family kinase protein
MLQAWPLAWRSGLCSAHEKTCRGIKCPDSSRSGHQTDRTLLKELGRLLATLHSLDTQTGDSNSVRSGGGDDIPAIHMSTQAFNRGFEQVRGAKSDCGRVLNELQDETVQAFLRGEGRVRTAASRLVNTHSDFHPGNIMQSPSGELQVLDLERMAAGRRYAAGLDYAYMIAEWRVKSPCFLNMESSAVAAEAFAEGYANEETRDAVLRLSRSLELYDIMSMLRYLKLRVCDSHSNLDRSWGWGKAGNAHSKLRDWLDPTTAFKWLLDARKHLAESDGAKRPPHMSKQLERLLSESRSDAASGFPLCKCFAESWSRPESGPFTSAGRDRSLALGYPWRLR